MTSLPEERGSWVRLLTAVGVIVLVALGIGLVSDAISDRGGPGDPLTPAQRAFLADRPLRIGWFDGAEPVSFHVDGEVVGGYGVEEWDLMALKLGIDVEHVSLPDIPTTIAALQDGEIDVSGTNGDRPDLLAFATGTEPLGWERITFVGSPEQAVRGLDDMAGRRVSTIAGSPLEAALVSQFPEAEYVTTDTIPDGLNAAADGTIDLYLSPLAVAGDAIINDGLEITPVGSNVQTVPIRAWARTGTTAAEIMVAARAQLTDEELSLITFRSTGFDLGDPDPGTPAWLQRSLLAALGAALVLIAFVWVLRRRVAAATAELQRVNEDLEARVERRTAELQISNAALSRVARSTAHDLKGPVVAITGMTDLLQHVELSPEQRAEMLSIVNRSGRKLAGMIDGLLEDAISSGATRPELSGAEFRSWLQDISKAEMQAIDGSLVVHADPGRIDADPVLLQRATINLVSNAVKYAVNEEGTRVEVRLSREPDRVLLTVDDNGPGVPDGLSAQIFESGFRADEDNRGHGLGLAELREAVLGAGGTVEVSASPLGGARFVVGLPAGRIPTDASSNHHLPA